MSIIRVQFKDDQGRRCSTFCDTKNLKCVEIIGVDFKEESEINQIIEQTINEKEKE